MMRRERGSKPLLKDVRPDQVGVKVFDPPTLFFSVAHRLGGSQFDSHSWFDFVFCCCEVSALKLFGRLQQIEQFILHVAPSFCEILDASLPLLQSTRAIPSFNLVRANKVAFTSRFVAKNSQPLVSAQDTFMYQVG